jgi:hypothetical protein
MRGGVFRREDVDHDRGPVKEITRLNVDERTLGVPLPLLIRKVRILHWLERLSIVLNLQGQLIMEGMTVQT